MRKNQWLQVLEGSVEICFSTLAWKIPWTDEPGRLQSMGSLGVGHDWALHFQFSLSCIGEGNGNPLQCSCLENPRDGGAGRATIYGVAQSRTWLKRLSSSSSSKSCTRWASHLAPVVKNPSVNAGDTRDMDLIPGSGRSPGEENVNPLQYFCLGNPMDRGRGGLQSMGHKESHTTRHGSVMKNGAQMLPFSLSKTNLHKVTRGISPSWKINYDIWSRIYEIPAINSR